MRLDFHTLDVFTDTRFGGNPLAVVLAGDGLAAETMQTIAREFNLSETVFVLKPADGVNTAQVRIFTPARELPFAGHPTVGAAILLAELERKEECAFETTLRLEEKVGLVAVLVRRLGPEPAYAELTAAKLPQAAGAPPSHEAIATALSLTPGDIGFGAHAPCLFNAGNAFLFVPLASRRALATARVNSSAWEAVQAQCGVGAYLYCGPEDEGGADYHARLFAPGDGIVEDPATGSAAATLPGPLLEAGALAEGANAITIAQGEDMGRPSRIALFADVAAGAISQVRVGGQAVRVSQGSLETDR
jgi:trans-2,3-dihydro-3-hydroxyanthranilate isomerase